MWYKANVCVPVRCNSLTMELHPFNDRNLIQLHLGCRPTSPQSINVTTPQSDRSIRISPRPISIIERLVAAHAIEVSQNLFSWMDPPSLISLGRTSRIMNGAVRIYSKKSWKIGELFAQFVDRKSIAAFRTLLMLSRALVFGPAALMFFDRMHRYCIRLDVAVPLNAIRDFVHFLALEGYSIQGGIPSFIHKLKSRMHPRTISGCGDRHMAERDRTRADIFVFTKKDRRLGSGDTKHVILVHLIQSEAYQYVLAQHSSEYFTPKHAPLYSHPCSLSQVLLCASFRTLQRSHYSLLQPSANASRWCLETSFSSRTTPF